MKATKRLIDSVWTLEFEVLNGNEVKILKYSRDDQEGYDNERTLPQCRVVEDDDRNAISVLIRDKYDGFEWVDEKNCDKTYKVVNVMHIFSY